MLQYNLYHPEAWSIICTDSHPYMTCSDKIFSPDQQLLKVAIQNPFLLQIINTSTSEDKTGKHWVFYLEIQNPNTKELEQCLWFDSFPNRRNIINIAVI